MNLPPRSYHHMLSTIHEPTPISHLGEYLSPERGTLSLKTWFPRLGETLKFNQFTFVIIAKIFELYYHV